MAFIKQKLQPPWLRYMGRFRNQTNVTSHPNIGSLKTAIEEEWDKMSEEFILKVCKSFRRCVDTIIEKIVDILTKFIVCVCLLILLFFN